MIARIQCSPTASAQLRDACAMPSLAGACAGELEFREVPYFMVSRSAANWSDAQGDINTIRVLSATALGLVIDPLSETNGGEGTEAVRQTLVPWTNVVSLTLDKTLPQER